MRASLLLLVALIAPFLLLGARQNPPPEPPKPRPVPEAQTTPSPGAQKEMARVAKEMQGLWRLKELEWPRLRGLSSESRGYCLVGGNHFSMEIHIGLRGSDKSFKDVMLDSGIWRFDLQEGSTIQLTALVGSFVDKDNRVAFREAGTRHRYGLLVSGDLLVLTHEDGQKISFSRVIDDGPVLRDAFGRPTPEKKEGEGQDGEKKDGDEKKPGDEKKGGEQKPEERSPDTPRAKDASGDG